MKKPSKPFWIIYSLIGVGLILAFYFWVNDDGITCGLPPICTDSIRKDSSFRDSIMKVETAAAAAESAKRKSDSLKQSRFHLSDTIKNK